MPRRYAEVEVNCLLGGLGFDGAINEGEREVHEVDQGRELTDLPGNYPKVIEVSLEVSPAGGVAGNPDSNDVINVSPEVQELGLVSWKELDILMPFKV